MATSPTRSSRSTTPARTAPRHACTLTDGQTQSVSGLPLLTTCTLTESGKPATTDISYVYGTESWTPSNVVTISSSETPVSVTLTNPIDRVLGSFSVTKHVTGETGGYVEGSQFTVDYTCTDGSSGTLHLVDGGTATVNDLPLLTTCTLTESAKPATTDASYVYGTESWDPSNTVTIETSEQVAALVLTNPIDRVLGGFSVTKHVTGATAGYVNGSMFTVDYTCSDGTDGSLTLSDGSTTGVTGLPLGTTCTLTESGKPATAGSTYTYGQESWSPSNVVTITANESENTTALTLTNPLTNTPAEVLAQVMAQPASLPVTGSSNTLMLLLIAGLLIVAGGCFVTAAKVQD